MSSALAHVPHTEFRAPTDLTADAPPEERGIRRDGVRLLVASEPSSGEQHVVHTTFDRLGDHVRPGDLLVVNDSATVPGEIDAHLVGRGAATARRRPPSSTSR